MYGKSWKGTGPAALFVFAAACGDDPLAVGGAGSLTNAEAADVALDVADAMDGILDGEIDARPFVGPETGDGVSQVAFSMVPVETEFEFTRTRPCRAGGQVVATGSGVHIVDRETGSLTLEFSGDKSIEDCARARGDLVLTLNGAGTFEGHRRKEGGQWVGLQTNDQEGSFAWETNGGRSGECAYEIHVTWDPASHTKTVTGFVCDREIDRTVTRDGAAGDDDDDDGQGDDDDDDG